MEYQRFAADARARILRQAPTPPESVIEGALQRTRPYLAQADWAELARGAAVGVAVGPVQANLTDSLWADLDALRRQMLPFFPRIKRCLYLPFVVKLVLRFDERRSQTAKAAAGAAA